MRIAHFDCPSGAAGDMILGALVDAGLSFEALEEGLRGLHLEGWRLERREVMKGAFRATKIEVRIDGDDAAHDHPHSHDHPHDHSHDHPHDHPHHHDHADDGHHRHDAAPSGAHPHRHLDDILALIAHSALPAPVKDSAARVFTRLGEAEARVHGTSLREVHFHEVGAVDAIVDIVGACLGLHLLGVDQVTHSALPIGGGFVTGAHGMMPVPAPATLELLKGAPVVDTGIRHELVTPTGAAILTTLGRGAGRMPAMTIAAVGSGAGTADFATPNLIRLFVGEATAADGAERVLQLETTVDDMSPQLWEGVMERLFATGALDVHLTAVTMKKGRPGILLTALAPAERIDALNRVLFEETPTIGTRWTEYRRAVLDREMVPLVTVHGEIPFKVSRLAGEVVTVTPEFEEVRRIARAQGLPVRTVLETAGAEGRRQLGGRPAQ